MESLSAVELSAFGKPGRCYGALLRVRGQAFIFGGTERGIFYRFGANINEHKPGQWNAFFGVRTKVGIASLMITKWMKDDVVPVRFRGGRVRGSMHFSHTGIISYIGGSVLPKADFPALSANIEDDKGGDIDSDKR